MRFLLKGPFYSLLLFWREGPQQKREGELSFNWRLPNENHKRHKIFCPIEKIRRSSGDTTQFQIISVLSALSFLFKLERRFIDSIDFYCTATFGNYGYYLVKSNFFINNNFETRIGRSITYGNSFPSSLRPAGKRHEISARWNDEAILIRPFFSRIHRKSAHLSFRDE
jgi:hypothetical protein